MAYTKATKDGLVPFTDNKRPLRKEELPTFNLSDLNYTQLYRDLQKTFDRGKPVLFKSFGVKRARLDVEHQEWVLHQIRNLRNINSELVNLKAETFLNEQVLTNLINGYQAEAERRSELIIEEHLTAIYELKTKREMLDLQKRSVEADVILKEEKAELIRFIRGSISFHDLRPHHKTMLAQAMLYPDGNARQDIEMLEDVKQYIIQEAEAKARLSIATAEEKEAQAKIANTTADQSVYNLDRIRNKPKGD
ncbi:MAG TPA: hypothetical protein PK122_06370 [Candidatus Paceibacterota bacterium]|nr:hypothetical protein [Candidatus Paceibacterota bacterium]HPQ42916.1 hypothetical protein [Syntrophales bacterium]